MFYPSVSVKRSLPTSTGHNSSFMVYHAELLFLKKCSADNHIKNTVSTQRNPHYGLCREPDESLFTLQQIDLDVGGSLRRLHLPQTQRQLMSKSSQLDLK